MTIKFDAGNSEQLTAPSSPSFDLAPSGWAIGLCIPIDNLATGNTEQIIIGNETGWYVSYTGSGHANPNTIRFNGRDGEPYYGNNNILTAGTKLYVVMQQIGSDIYIGWCPSLATQPINESAVSSAPPRGVLNTFPRSGVFSIGGPVNGQPGLFLDQSLTHVFKLTGELTLFDIANLAYGKTIQEIGKTPDFALRMNDANDITDTGTGANVFTKVGTLSPGTNPGFGFGTAPAEPTPPTGTILPSPQPDPSGQAKRFILTTANATSGAYTLIGQNGAPNIGPSAFAVANDAADFTVQGIAPASYLPRLTLSGPDGIVNIDGDIFTIVPVSGGGGEVETPPGNPAPTAPGTIPVIAGSVGVAINPVLAAAAFSDTDALSYSISPAGAAWPLGLGVHTSTGVISGTVAEVTVATGLKVRATDTAGQSVDSSPFSVAITAASNPDNDPLFKPSVIRTIRAKAGVLKFDGGAFWNLAVPSTPVGVIDPDAIVDITMDWAEVLADIQDTIAGADVEATNADIVQAFTVGAKTTVFITAAKGNLVQIRFRIDTQSIPSRREDRTVYLKVGEQ